MTSGKAAVLREFGAPLSVEEIELPEPGPGQLRVRVHYSGFCRKQLEEMAGSRPDPFLPHLMGHEGAGIIEAVGEGVVAAKPGDHVVLSWIASTGVQSETPDYKSASGHVNAGWVTTFNERAIVSENRVTPIRKDMPLDKAALLGCAVPTGAGSFLHEEGLTTDSTVAIFGTGGIGLNAIQAAAYRQVKMVIAIDVHDEKLEMAKAFGATHTINATNEDPVNTIKELTGDGADFTFESAGLIKTMEQAYESASNRAGKVILAGVNPASEKLCIDPYPLHFGKVLAGTAGGFSNPAEDYPRYVDLYLEGKWKLDELITHRFSLDEINEAADTLRSGKAGRVLIDLT
jgi:S-(hydroxymethyl)glutathione dehydrogenase / alcohol dehydrogenase